jgi:hypothetical protein
VRSFEQPLACEAACWLAGTPLLSLGLLAAAWIVADATLPAAAARPVGLAVAHGALLGTALAWTSDGETDRWAPLYAASLLLAATLAGRMLPGGVVVSLAVPIWVLRRRPAWLGAGARSSVTAVLRGGVFGTLLALHVLISVSLTIGYRVRLAAPEEFLPWWFYDLSANVLAAEAFFRVALFGRAYRRWPLVGAVTLSTGGSLLRYLVDPLLPHSVEIVAGALFYLALLGVGNCWLLVRTGSVLAPLTAGVLFFAAYRSLAPR